MRPLRPDVPGLPVPSGGAPAGRIELRAEFGAIGPAMDRLVGELGGAAAGEELTADLRLAVTEALNNVVEHSGHPRGEPVVLHFGRAAAGWWVCVEDMGVPLPPSLLDVPTRPDPAAAGPLDDLPEGGWGWLLIRGSVDRLSHVRVEGRNFLLLEKRMLEVAAA